MILHAIILGIIQGLTEFLPISSSAHLLTIPTILRWKDLGLAFDVALHWGTILAIIIYFRKDWATILSGVLHRKSEESDGTRGLLLPIIVGTIPAAIAGALLEDKIEALRGWPLMVPVIACVLMGVGLIMLLAERVGKQKRDMGSMNWTDYIVIGLAQALALFPGVSRSGITISAGLFRNIDRTSAARFSFLLSTPAIIGAGLMSFRNIGTDFQAAPFAIGFLTSAVMGYLAIHFLMRFLAKHPLNLFVNYRFIFAIVLLLVSQ